MNGHQSQQFPQERPTLASVHQLAIQRADTLNLLLEKTMDRQHSLRRRKLQLEARLEALMDDIQQLKQKWRIS